ncbi:hypothetical protein B0H66DRAFT_243817 [Apodospora peruviana]|uniref:tRNA-splicing endonuclease subunit Sen34 n=1 Tax=Apodospora peruviana TaxID=516989 RepID=A0AAE0I6L3_9PEZI|nr:hypothetical protein B0H66DRAFT_243817 [Apodospora peruviana]
MSSTKPDRQVRISRIAGRYLVFDIDDVAYIRRNHGICAVFTGTMPQNPTQNVFLGLPVELYAEEAKLLAERKAGYIADDPADHLSQLKAMDTSARKAYIQSLNVQRKNAKLVFDEAKTQSLAKHKDKRKAKTPLRDATDQVSLPDGDALFDPLPAQPAKQLHVKEILPAVTPTTSNALIVPTGDHPSIEVPSSYPLYKYLNVRGYFITPGLRFGGDYSVYPGDPFRYHAHYLANSYEWDQAIPMLDLLTSGRLGTAVKKSFLLGGRDPAAKNRDQGDEDRQADGDLRVFCIEWAGM